MVKTREVHSVVAFRIALFSCVIHSDGLPISPLSVLVVASRCYYVTRTIGHDAILTFHVARVGDKADRNVRI